MRDGDAPGSHRLSTQGGVTLDGAEGEGGGQILRTALALSILQQRPLHIHHIRAGRTKPGLLRQHLTAVRAAADLCSASVEGAELGSAELRFSPGPLPPPGTAWRLDIQSAGSTGLVLQTVLLPLARAGGATVEILGGTHNGASPPADFLQRTFAPLAARCGLPLSVRLDRHGFYPAGGGAITAHIGPAAPAPPLDLTGWRPDHSRVSGAVRACRLGSARRLAAAEALRAAVSPLLPADPPIRLIDVPGPGPGLALQLCVPALPDPALPDLAPPHDPDDHGPALILTAVAGRDQPCGEAAAEVVAQLSAVLAAGSMVDEYLADQALLPLALSGGGRFLTGPLSQHTRTNIEVIRRFLPVEIAVTEEEGPGSIYGSIYRIEVRP